MKKILLLLLCINCFGCAAMYNNKTDKIKVNSQPQGAEVYFNGLLVGTTPLTSIASEQEPLTIQISKDGYKRAFKTIDTHTEYGWYFIDFFPFIPFLPLEVILGRGSKNLQALDEKDLSFVLEPL